MVLADYIIHVGRRFRRVVMLGVFAVVMALVLGVVGAPSARAADPITTKYNALGGSQSFLGNPTSATYTTPGGGQARDSGADDGNGQGMQLGHAA